MGEPQTATLHWRYTLVDNDTGAQADLTEVTDRTYGANGVNIAGLVRVEGEVKKGGLRANFGVEAHDPGYRNTSSTASPITFIDGKKGVLLHHGHNIKDLVPNCDHMEVTCLLREGELPNQARLDEFKAEMAGNVVVPQYVLDTISLSPKNAKPMAVLASAVSALAATRPEDDQEGHHIIAQMPTLVAAIIRHQNGDGEFIAPNPSLSYSQNFLHMLGMDTDEASVAALDKLLILHGDHEQNCGTGTVRFARSSHTSPYEAVTAGITALAGPRHGGANVKVMNMLDELVAEQAADGLSDDEVIDRLIERVRNKEQMLQGFGHAVYTNVDPRATVLRGFVENLLEKSGSTDQRFVLAQKIAARALANPHFITESKKLNPNVDFYSGVAMELLKIKPEHFTLMFALGRTAGWVAQAEEVMDSKVQIYRPRQTYVGPEERPVVPIEQRIGANGGPDFFIDVEGDEPNPGAAGTIKRSAAGPDQTI